MSFSNKRSSLDRRLVLTALLLLLLSPTICASSAMAGETRVDRRAAEMALPDPYLDPTFPDEQLGVGPGDHDETGDTGSVEDIPLLDENEEEAERRALQALTGDAPGDPNAPNAPADPAEPAVPADGVAPGGAAPAPSVDEDEIAPGDDDRDSLEW